MNFTNILYFHTRMHIRVVSSVVSVILGSEEASRQLRAMHPDNLRQITIVMSMNGAYLVKRNRTFVIDQGEGQIRAFSRFNVSTKS